MISALNGGERGILNPAEQARQQAASKRVFISFGALRLERGFSSTRLYQNRKPVSMRRVFCFGGGGGIRTHGRFYSPLDFESVRLLGSYRTILPQSRLILVVVFQLLNASAIMSSLLDRWREGQTHWRYYSTKTPKNQGVLRK